MPQEGYPLYRAMANGRSLFRIRSAMAFTEVQRIGDGFVVHEVVAHTYPEKLRIAELVECRDNAALPSDAATFDHWMALAVADDRRRGPH